ncbi:MAG: S41 family peptidase [Paludibacteraceae bacterium]|jgi:C-terminal peptidase (prc)|nr:S41 family peptidase [Paludibacteraceae bacterium]
MKHPILTILAITCFLNSWADGATNRNVEIAKHLDIFNAVYKELDLLYVDTIKPEKTIKKGIDEMLSSLDPYTNYIPQDDMDKLKMMTTGEYAGVGCVISQKKEGILITDVYEGMPAQKAGIRTGDLIVEINGKSAVGLNVTDASEQLRGESKTQVEVTVKRTNGKKTKMVITREKISIPAIPFYTEIEPGIGYIYINGFTEKSAAQFKNAFLDLKENKKISKLIIDVRENPGGILDEAVDIINLFVDRKSTVVYTKGKNPNLNKTYKATRDPIDKDMPIAVLVNRNSASASEIVAGALQDMDRAVIIGERSFGKGLVQTTRDLPHGGNLKVTISKYYIPSGRCIQAIDYSKKNGKEYSQRIPDSLTHEFKTIHGRTVRDGGGINPDIFSADTVSSTAGYYLYEKDVIFDYVTEYQKKHPSIPNLKDFTYTDKDYDEFKAFVKERNFTYESFSETILTSLKESLKEEGYAEYAEAEIKALEAKIKHNIDTDLNLFKKEIVRSISIEIAKRYYFQTGMIIESLKFDDCKNEAIKLLNDTERYKKILTAEQGNDKKE